MKDVLWAMFSSIFWFVDFRKQDPIDSVPLKLYIKDMNRWKLERDKLRVDSNKFFLRWRVAQRELERKRFQLDVLLVIIAWVLPVLLFLIAIP